jgi:hypothetical protein
MSKTSAGGPMSFAAANEMAAMQARRVEIFFIRAMWLMGQEAVKRRTKRDVGGRRAGNREKTVLFERCGLDAAVEEIGE